MPSFVLTRKAKEDLRSIARYTERTWGRAQRNHYLQLLDNSFHAIAENPRTGTDCNDIREGYRKYPAGKHLVFYRQLNGVIEIVRVLHERMDVEHQLGNMEG